MKKLFLTIYCSLMAILCFAQDFVTERTKKLEQLYSEEYAKYWCYDDICDTLLLEDGSSALLLRTPIRYIDGYVGLFYTGGKLFDCEALITNHSGLGARGYSMIWRLKDMKLYLEKVCWSRLEWFDWDNNFEPRLGPDVALEEIKRRVEQLTSRKFNEEGLLFADWVTDRILIVKYYPYRLVKEKNSYTSQSLDEIFTNHSKAYLSKVVGADTHDDSFVLHRSQKIFALDFMRGELRNIYECVNVSHGQLLKDLHDKVK